MAFSLFSRKRKSTSTMISICIVILYFTVPDPRSRTSSVAYEHLIDNLTPERDSQASCGKIPPIYYVKIHKTGSSTLQNILYRIGLKQDLFFALFACPYGMTYPNPPQEQYTFGRPTAENFTGYHFITDHTMYDDQAYKAYMPEDTKVITLLRHPLKQLKSTFGFWNLPQQLQIPSTEDAIAEFLKQPGKYEKTRNSFGCPPTIQISQTKNPQSHHLGLKNQAEAMERPVEQLIKGLDKNMSLVLILERFEESLILMKRMFCLATRDIIHLSLFSTQFFNRRTYSYEESNESDLINKHRRYSTSDYLLYEHFAAKLDHTIQEEGAGFQVELESFREIKTKVRNFCNASCVVFSQLVNEDVAYVRDKLSSEFITIENSKWNEEFRVSRADCAMMMFETLIYDEAIKAKQWPDRCTSDPSAVGTKRYPHVNSNYCNKQDHFVPYFSWNALKSSAYFTQSSCQKSL